MTDMAKHASSNDSGLRRARAAAWTVFLSMAGTTMTFQVYHSIEYGRMPWPLAALYGAVPLLISVCILEVIAEWRGSPAWAKAAAYSIMGGAMFMSAAATGEVVLNAAPRHWSLLFGFLLDAAALLTVHFLLSGSHAVSRAQAEAEAARRAELETAHATAAGERAAREEAETAAEALRRDLAAALGNLATATRKLETVTARKRRGATARKPGAATGRKQETATGSVTAPETLPEGGADLDAEARVLGYLAEGKSASEAGRLAGVSDSRGRQIARALAAKAPAGQDSQGD